MTASTEQTWRSLKVLHRWFASVSVLLLLATIWMLASDHYRPWKAMQRTGNEIEFRMAQWRSHHPQSPQEFERLQATLQERRSTYITWHGMLPLPGKRLLELPILDAFNSPRKIENLWCDGLEIDIGHRKVRRFDRCTTCHQAIDDTLPGTSDQPAFEREREITWILEPAVGDSPPGVEGTDSQEIESLVPTWGIYLVQEGLLDDTAVTVCCVQPQSPAALAKQVDLTEPTGPVSGRELRESLLQPKQVQMRERSRGLRVGDILLRVDGESFQDVADLATRMNIAAQEGNSVTVTVRRGLPHPYRSHPRLDLFVSASSPHPKSTFACTICHEGQGSATDFKWASHAPDSETQRHRWQWQYGWFDNSNWMYPMYPKRFAESTCLKCHHDVEQLRPSDQYPQAAAPKLLKGYRLIQTYGCFGCHEIRGVQSDHRVGPDMRLEPPWSAVAAQLKQDPGIQQWCASDRNLLDVLIRHPDHREARRRIRELVDGDTEASDPRLSLDTRTRLASLSDDLPDPGTYRKVGPSLRHLAQKLDGDFLVSFLRDPRAFRSSSRMPRFFGPWQHLKEQGRGVAERLEPIEVLGIVTYLRARSQNQSRLMPPEGIAESDQGEQVARGKVLFQERGCLACHTHRDFSNAEAYRDPDDIPLGPDLSGIAPKFSHPAGREWLYSWIKNPIRHNARTRMPETFLEPVPNADGTSTDPARDIVEYLLASSTSDWSPSPDLPATAGDLDAEQVESLDELVRDSLRDVFSQTFLADYAVRGIPASRLADLRGAEIDLLIPDAKRTERFHLSVEQKLLYVGHKAIARRGCYGCHDIAGMEGARPIGPALSDWGRKDESQLAFEQVGAYLESSSADTKQDPVAPFYMHQILAGHRPGFIYQKLRDPRGYDYELAEHKRYSEWLRMPQFSFTFDQREAIITFVLGLVADPPRDRYVCEPDPQREAVIAGERLLEQYRCTSCHMTDPQEWRLAFEPGEFQAPPDADTSTFPFLVERANARRIAASMKTDGSGQLHAIVRGMPALGEDGLPLVFYDYVPVEDEDTLDPDEDFEPAYLDYSFQLWDSALLEGNVWDVGMKPFAVEASGLRSVTLSSRRPARGGFLAKYLLPHVVQRDRKVNSNSNGAEAWGWLPPPLHGEGDKVQTNWLHEFLLNPISIRPSVVVRMPRYGLSREEATNLVRYFAAVDGADYPYSFSSRRQAAYLETAERAYQHRLERLSASGDSGPGSRLDHAMRILVDRNYCVRCHMVGDFQPEVSDKVKAPNLARIHRRLRPEYVRRWIAHPASILPYTGMPVNISYDADTESLGGVRQDLFDGSSIEQLDALVDLLMNYDEYAKQRSHVAPLVKTADPPVEPE